MDQVIDDKKCPHCGGPRLYSNRYSAFYCAPCEIWFGHYCPGEECDMCDMCPKLPPKPPKRAQDISLSFRNRGHLLKVGD